MALTGELVVAGGWARSPNTFVAREACSGQALQPPFCVANDREVDSACRSAWSAFETLRELDSECRAKFLEAIADEVMGLGEELLTRASAESGLPIARLTNERARTTGQLRLFAAELRAGGWLGIRVDPPLPERQPLPRPALRQYRVPLGPVAIFGASNFPLAFSVSGGDSAAALAAGCPIVVKGHPAHPGTSELAARAIVGAAHKCGMPSGIFSLLHGDSPALGSALVAHPCIKAVGFTGSRRAGLALMKVARERSEPIPVYAEMSSINPVFLLPGALTSRAESLAKEFVSSLTLGTGQFCTNPGLVIALEGPGLDRFIKVASEAINQVMPSTMLTSGIHSAYESSVERLVKSGDVRLLARGQESKSHQCGRAALFSVDANVVATNPELMNEVFGPSGVLVRCVDEAQLIRVLDQLEGQLTASLHFVEQDLELVRLLVRKLEGKVGRMVANGWPTGVEVSHAMVHGGPFPATSDGRSTSVGTLAIERFLRPVCYQDFPDALLPAPLCDEALARLPHRFDGSYRV